MFFPEEINIKLIIYVNNKLVNLILELSFASFSELKLSINCTKIQFCYTKLYAIHRNILFFCAI